MIPFSISVMKAMLYLVSAVPIPQNALNDNYKNLTAFNLLQIFCLMPDSTHRQRSSVLPVPPKPGPNDNKTNLLN